MYLYKPELKFK